MEQFNDVISSGQLVLADFSTWVSTNGVEVAEQNALDGSTRGDIVGDDFLRNLLCVAVG